VNEQREELERIWREMPLRFANYKAGWMMQGAALRLNLAYFDLKSDLLVSVRGARIPTPRRKHRLPANRGLTLLGLQYYDAQRNRVEYELRKH